jgi:hypothetical protein
MTAGNFSLTIEQGATFSLVITYKDSAGSAINLTGFSIRYSGAYRRQRRL